MEWIGSHPDDESVERYSMELLTEEECSVFEEHILLCELCRERVTQSDEYLAAMRTAATRLRAAETTPTAPLDTRGGGGRWWLPRLNFNPAPMAGVAAAAALAVVLLGPKHIEPLGSASLQLTATRGATPALAEAPAGHSLDLSLDLTGLPVAESYRVELADGRGRVLWADNAPRSGSRVEVSYPEGCEPGHYWVRLSSASGGVLREYGLQVVKRSER